MDKYSVLEENFGFKKYKYPQDIIIDYVLQGLEVIGLLPTGFGKSIIYQVLALMLDGVSIIISPLISLMEDQLYGLRKRNIPAAVLNSNMSTIEQEHVLQNLLKKKYRLIYVSPERLMNYHFLNIIMKCRVAMVVLDEAHTILWAEGFRKSFGEIGSFLDSLENRPRVLAVTATATSATILKIEQALRMKNPKVIEGSVDRSNLVYKVIRTKNKINYIKRLIQLHSKEKGILYCLTRKRVEELYLLLRSNAIPCTYYHGGLDSNIKKQNQSEFTEGRVHWLICTNAFGMGIDVPDIRYVIAYEMPQSLEDLVQQMGRAARDGGYGEGIVLFSFEDIKTINFFIEQQTNSKVRKEYEKKKEKIIEYCLTRKCRHSYIGKYFNQKIKACKKNCDNCF